MRRLVLAICAAVLLTACAPDPQVERARADAELARSEAARASAASQASQAAALSNSLEAQSTQIGALVDVVTRQAESWRAMAGLLAVGVVLIVLAGVIATVILAMTRKPPPPTPVIFQIMQPQAQPMMQLHDSNQWPVSQRHAEAVVRALLERQALPPARQIGEAVHHG